jgi:glutaredoxin
MSQPALSERPRCAQHNLAAGPDGLCVVCRRESTLALGRQATLPPRSGGLGVLLGAALVVLIGVGVSAGTRKATDERSASPEPAAVRVDGGERTEVPEGTEPEQDGPVRKRHTILPSSLDRPEDEVTDAVAPRNAARERQGDAAENRRAPPEVESAPARPASQDEMRSYLRQVQVELYSTSWCGYCTKARAFFRSNGIVFREYDVEADAAAAERKKRLSSESGVPLVNIEGIVISGYSPRKYGEAIRSSVERRSGVSVVLTGM